MFLAAGDNPLSHVLPHKAFEIGGLEISNHMFMAVVAAVLMLLVFPLLFSRPRSDAPSGSRNFFEAILSFLRTEVFRPALKQHTDRFVPFLWTLFFFILFCNLLGAIPLNEAATLATQSPQHFWGTATGNINTTAALAVVTFLFIHLAGIWQVMKDLLAGTYGHHHHEEHGEHGESGGHGGGGHGHQQAHHGHGQAEAGKGMALPLALPAAIGLYFWNFAPHPFKPGPNDPKTGWLADIPLWALLLVLELIGAVIKPFALTIRLFANMIAGHIVLAVLVMLIPVTLGVLPNIAIGIPVTLGSLFIRVLELFVSFLQAYIFTFLSTLFIAAAVAPEH